MLGWTPQASHGAKGPSRPRKKTTFPSREISAPHSSPSKFVNGVNVALARCCDESSTLDGSQMAPARTAAAVKAKTPITQRYRGARAVAGRLGSSRTGNEDEPS